MSKGKSHERFGPFVLFRRLESDALGELWRAAEWKADSFGSPVVVHRLIGGNRTAVKAAAERARPIVGGLTGTTVAREQRVGFSDGIPWLSHDYPGGRSLQSIVTKARASATVTPNPVPVDQALAIVEKLALSVEALENVRYQGARVQFGGVLPQFVWISEDGEVRAAGQQIGPGILASLGDADIRRDYAAYFAPELRSEGSVPTRSSDVWSLGAVLYLILVGEPLPDPADSTALEQSLRAPKLMHRQDLIPQEILTILRRSLAVATADRYPSAAEMRSELEKLLNSGEYAPTTFNLAFYLSGLLRREMEAEAAEREREAELRPGDFASASMTPAAAAAAPVVAPAADHVAESPFRTPAPEPEKRRTGLIVGLAALVLLAAGVAGWLMLTPRSSNAAQSASLVQPAGSEAPLTQQPAAESIGVEPIIAQGSVAADQLPADEAARQRVREAEISRRLQEEMLKLQAQYDRDLQQQRSKAQAAITANSPPPKAANTQAPETRTAAAAPVTAPPQTSTTSPVQPASPPSAPPASQPAQAAQEAPAAAQPAAPAPVAAPSVREGDLVAISDLDRAPELTAPVRPTYPPIALRMRAEGSVIVSVLINESGRVEDVRVLRGDTSRMGFEDAAIRAVRQATFSPPMKDGKRVKTWKPVPVVFKP